MNCALHCSAATASTCSAHSVVSRFIATVNFLRRFSHKKFGTLVAFTRTYRLHVAEQNMKQKHLLLILLAVAIGNAASERMTTAKIVAVKKHAEGRIISWMGHAPIFDGYPFYD